MSEAARKALLAHDWPGNVRELGNAIIRACQLCEGNNIEAVDLGLSAASTSDELPQGPHSLRKLRQKQIEAFERDYLIHLMTVHKGNITHAARAAGQERRQLGKLLKKHRLDPASFRHSSTRAP